MTPDPVRFRILLVDDETDLRQQLKIVLESLPSVRVEDCADVQSAHRVIDETTANGKFFDAAVLDFCLPNASGQRDDVPDFTLCQKLGRSGTMIWHITAYRGRDDIEKHIADYHSKPGTEPRVIRKDFEFIEQLFDQLRQALPTRRIHRQLDEMRDPSEGGGRCSTALLAGLCEDISIFWPDLAPGFQVELKEAFLIDPSTDPVSVYPR